MKCHHKIGPARTKRLIDYCVTEYTDLELKKNITVDIDMNDAKRMCDLR